MEVILHALYWIVVIGAFFVFYRVAPCVLKKQNPDKPQQSEDPGLRAEANKDNSTS